MYGDIFFAAPWSMWMLNPLAFLSERTAQVIVFFLALTIYFLIVRKGNRWSMLFILLSPPVIADLIAGNIEWMAMMCLIVPERLSVIFALIKPQSTIGFIIAKTLHGNISILYGTLAMLISILPCNFWFLHYRDTLSLTQGYNISLWPMGIPIGVALLASAWQEKRSGIEASPFLSPYCLTQTWTGPLLMLLNKPLQAGLVVMSMWGIVAFQVLTR